jgi:hypothetical protein
MPGESMVEVRRVIGEGISPSVRQATLMPQT